MAALAAVTVFGTVGYLLLGFDPLEAVYQTVTTVATVGFREVRPLTPTGMVFTTVLIVVGVGTVLYNLGVLVEAVTEGHLRRDLERRRMDHRIAALHDHVIVCGHGRVGRAAAEFLYAGGNQLVVVDNNHVTDNAVLEEAGIARARAVVVALDSDADTVYATLSARALRPDVVIVARARTTESKAKLELAGASRAVNPQLIGGRRLAVFALQPDVAEFLDVVIHDDTLDWRIQQVPIAAGSALADRPLGSSRLRERTGALVLAVRRGPGADLVANPADDLVLPPGTVLIALGAAAELERLSRLARIVESSSTS